MRSPRKPTVPVPIPAPAATPAASTPTPILSPNGDDIIILLDPGHGMANRRPGLYDPGTTHEGIQESHIVLDWSFLIQQALRAHGALAYLTRPDHTTPTPLRSRVPHAQRIGAAILVSIHVNYSSDPNVGGTETFYRGQSNRGLASDVNTSLVRTLGTRDRRAKTEADLGSTLAILSYPRAILIELGFIKNTHDRAAILDPELRRLATQRLAPILIRHATA